MKTEIEKEIYSHFFVLLFFFFNIYSLVFSFSSYGHFQNRSPLTIIIQYSALIILIIFPIINLRRNIYNITVNRHLLLLMVLIFWCFATSFWSVDYKRTLLSAILLSGMLLSLGLTVGTAGNFRNFSKNAIWGIIFGLIILGLSLEIRERTFGFVTPNLIASYGFALVFFAFVCQIRFWYFIALVGASLIVFAQGRSILISLVIFLTIIGAQKVTKNINILLLFLCFLAGLFVIFALFADSIISAVVWMTSSVLGITLNQRLDASLTGRSQFWEMGMTVFESSPFLGLGFGTRGDTKTTATFELFNAHSGIINSLIDVGIFGSTLFILSIFSAISKYFKMYAISGKRELWVYISFLVSYVPLLIVEPNYIAYLHPLSIIFLSLVGGAAFTGVMSRSSHKQNEKFG